VLCKFVESLWEVLEETLHYSVFHSCIVITRSYQTFMLFLMEITFLNQKLHTFLVKIWA